MLFIGLQLVLIKTYWGKKSRSFSKEKDILKIVRKAILSIGYSIIENSIQIQFLKKLRIWKYLHIFLDTVLRSSFFLDQIFQRSGQFLSRISYQLICTFLRLSLPKIYIIITFLVHKLVFFMFNITCSLFSKPFKNKFIKNIVK